MMEKTTMNDNIDMVFLEQLKKIILESPKQFSNILNHNKKFNDLKEWIIDKTKKLDQTRSLTERIFWILNGLEDFPKCKNTKCNMPLTNKKSFRGLILGYKCYCSKHCANSDQIQIAKSKETRLMKNGGKYFSDESINKAKLTFIEHYGVDNNMKSEKGLKEFQNSFETKYGVKNPWQVNQIKEKIRITKEEKYGSPTWNNPNTAKQTKFKKYGDGNYMNRIKFKQTCLKNYGVDHPMKDPNIAKRSFLNSKRKPKYLIDNYKFDSFPELCFYIWCRDNQINVICHPLDKRIRYQDEKMEWHTYYPDFYLVNEQQLVEIKGDNHFEDKDPTKSMISFKGKEFDHVERSKQKCMKENNVLLVTSSKYQKYLKYAILKYGKKFLLENYKVS